ncbi:hypothetical protein B0J15DRAFT_461736 [Fusarium solani]|uniref:Fungal-type protein kinase domain-containing protein n=1 Tax=Fusarium solani TaxID=169388 RepID=A0A9P9R9U7_FUSSL|nr:uncharacterized protein B0J15DRAFT_461736 [Fusarium solani]KAH7271716.1 hypothetical protein B0J15DRAFT_461736 [Fusarium solani]
MRDCQLPGLKGGSSYAFCPSYSNTFERCYISEKVDFILLRKHFSIVEEERAAEFNHVSIPWLIPTDGKVAGGYVVPRPWRFWDDKLEPYEFDFNHPGQEDYNLVEMLKSNPSADKASEAWLDLGRYAREVLAAQDTRRFALGFALCGSLMRV